MNLVISYGALIFSPLVSYFSFLSIILFSNRVIRLAVLPGLCIAFSLICASRALFQTYADDFETYYMNYLDDNFIHAITYFGTEVGLPIFNKVLYLFFGEVNPKQLLFLYVVFQFSLMYLALCLLAEKVVRHMGIISPYAVNVFIVFTLILLPFFAFTIYIRQSFAICIFLLAISLRSVKFSYVLIVLSFIFHHSIILFFALIKSVDYFGKNKTKKGLYFLSLLLFLPLGLTLIKNDFYTLYKVRAWLILDVEFNFIVFLSNYKYLIVSGLIYSIFGRMKSVSFYFSALFVFCFVVDYYIPYISVRFMLLFILLSGFIFALVYYSSNIAGKNIILFTMFLLIPIRIYSLVYNDNKYSDVFVSYPFSSVEPFYYLKEFSESSINNQRSY